MAGGRRSLWVRVVVAVVVAETLPVLVLVLIVAAYSFTRRADAPTPEEFAPVAGMWVGPLGGFLATFLCALWVARRSPRRPIVPGAAVGLGTALFDLGLGLLLGGAGPIHPVLFLSNGGRVLAGVLAGWLASRGGAPTRSPGEGAR